MKMNTLPRNIKAGCILGYIGGLISMVCLVLFFKPEEAAVETMGMYVLIAVLFFAMAGAFTKTGQWSWRILVFMCFVTIAIIGGLMIWGDVDYYAGSVLIAVAILMLACIALPTSKDWIDSNKL